jgi:membrane protein
VSVIASLTRAWNFFAERIWDARPEELSRPRAALHRASRVVVSTIRGYFDHRLPTKAAALTYTSVLSIVPFLAFAFAILKGFGVYRSFIQGTVRPYLEQTFAPNPALYQALDRILRFVDQTDVSKLGAVGIVFLVWTSVSLVQNVESALNDIYGARTTRPLIRQITDYVTLLVIGPILVFAATTFSTVAQSSSVVLFLRERLGLGPVIDFALGFTPVVVVGLAFFAMYMILPNVRTRALPALLGAALAAIAWQVALVLHVQLQMGVAKYNALYSVLGAIPIFLVWMYVSWLIVLLGAEVAAAQQNDVVVRQRLRAQHADQSLRETLAIAVAAQIARDFIAGGPRRSADELAELLAVPPPVVDGILEALARAGLVARTAASREVAYLPGRDLDAIRASDLREALERDPHADDVRTCVLRRLTPELRRVLRETEEERRASPYNATLRELAALAHGSAASDEPTGSAPPHGPEDADGHGEVDAKGPELHA